MVPTALATRAEVLMMGKVRAVTYMAATAVALLGVSVAAAGEGLRHDEVRLTHAADSENDRVIFGGLGLATATTRGKNVDHPAASTVSWRAVEDSREGVLYKASDGLILDFSVSPQGVVAVLVAKSDTWPRFDTPRALRVIDSSGRVITPDLADATGDLAWSGDGRYLAVCTGRADAERDDIDSSGTTVVDLGSGEVKKVSEEGRHVAWSASEESFYIYVVPGPGVTEEAVLRYDPATGMVSATERKGIHFSASGNYYFRNPSQNFGSFDLFESRSDTSLLATSAVLGDLVPQVIGWLADQDLLIFESWYYGENRRAAEKTPHTMVYDPSSDTVVDLGELAILGQGGPSKAVVWRSGTADQRPVAELMREGTTVSARPRRP